MRTTANVVVYMAAVRDLLQELDKLRADILAGEAKGWGGTVLYADGREVAYIGGCFRDNSEAQARAMLKVSALRMAQDEYLAPRKRTKH